MKKERIDFYKENFSDKFTPEQVDWMIDFERRTGFEIMCDEDMDFEQVVCDNIMWFQDWSDEMIEKLDRSSWDLFDPLELKYDDSRD